MKFQTTPAFDRDYRSLPAEHRRAFREKALPRFHDAAERAAGGGADPWPRSLRVKPVQRATGVWEMTWSMKQPDGRATWEWVQVDGEAAIRWRRIGDHSIFSSP
ncbi:MAG: hypothetical protein FGM34_01840 [Solirubrobacteraceae bacterium]|nr:hypothetical protein [Solirubrobacteraceae bacterium]